MPLAMKEEEISMLRAEIEMLMNERAMLLKVAGAAAVFIATTETKALPQDSYESVELMAESLNGLSEDSLRESLEAVKAHMDMPDLPPEQIDSAAE